jgi:hypothetical protein
MNEAAKAVKLTATERHVENRITKLSVKRAEFAREIETLQAMLETLRARRAG